MSKRITMDRTQLINTINMGLQHNFEAALTKEIRSHAEASIRHVAKNLAASIVSSIEIYTDYGSDRIQVTLRFDGVETALDALKE